MLTGMNYITWSEIFRLIINLPTFKNHPPFLKNKNDFLAKRQKFHNMLNIEVFDLERSHNVNVVDDDIFSSKAICVFLITVCILPCSNCDLLHKLKLSH